MEIQNKVTKRKYEISKDDYEALGSSKKTFIVTKTEDQVKATEQRITNEIKRVKPESVKAERFEDKLKQTKKDK